MFDKENAPPLNIIAERYQSRGHWEYLPVYIDTNLVQIPTERPKNFKFTFKWKTYPDSLYLDTSENLLVTLKGDVDTSIFFSLSESEMDTIYKKMRDIHFLCYPKDYRPGISGIMNPYFLFYCKMMANDFEKDISINTGQVSNDPSYKEMKDFLWMIYSIIRNSSDYKKIRKPTLINIYE
jgi:hypothetical protein